jgi:DNA-binding MarR family transcriptional regulator
MCSLLSSEIISPSKISIRNKSDLADQVFTAILESGENGILQTELCKVFSIDSRDGSRVVGNLEKQSLIHREKILYKGRWTYKLLIKKSQAIAEFARKPIEIRSVDGAPCFSCTYQHLCSSEDETSPYSPAKCIWIKEWVLTDFSSRTESIASQQDSSTIKSKD